MLYRRNDTSRGQQVIEKNIDALWKLTGLQLSRSSVCPHPLFTFSTVRITQKTFRFNRIPTHNDPYGSRTGTVSVCTENKMCHQKQNLSSQRKHWHWHIFIWKSSVGTETNICVLLFNVIYFQCQTYLIIIWYFFIFMSFFFFDNLKMFPFCHCSDSIEQPIIVTSHLQRANNWDQINDCTQNGWGQRKNEKGWRLNILAFIWMEW